MSPFFSVSTSPNRNNETVLNNNTSIRLCIVFAMTSKVRKKRKNFKINLEGEGLKKNSLKAEHLPQSGTSSALSEDLAGLVL